MSTVLLVDDEPNIRRLLSAVLKSSGFQVLEASNSADALALAKANHVDVLVTDVLLSDLDGPSLARCLTAENPSLLVVFISGYPMDIRAEQQRHPYCAFVLKPFPPKSLVSTIRSLAARRHP